MENQINMKPVSIEDVKKAYTARRGLYSQMIHTFWESGEECVETEVKGDVTKFYNTTSMAVRHSKDLKDKVKVFRRRNKVYLCRADVFEK